MRKARNPEQVSNPEELASQFESLRTLKDSTLFKSGLLPALAASFTLLGCGASSAGKWQSLESYADGPSIFGSAPVRADISAVLGRWNGKHLELLEGCAAAACLLRAERLDAAAGEAEAAATPLAAMAIVNATVNRTISYARDTGPSGPEDRWASPGETVSLGKGDCEDYAILKMAVLVKAGFPAESMAVVVVVDSRHKALHAVLAVRERRGSLIMDIKDDTVRFDDAETDYQPLYSISDGKSWLHGRKIADVSRLRESRGSGSDG